MSRLRRRKRCMAPGGDWTGVDDMMVAVGDHDAASKKDALADLEHLLQQRSSCLRALSRDRLLFRRRRSEFSMCTGCSAQESWPASGCKGPPHSLGRYGCSCYGDTRPPVQRHSSVVGDALPSKNSSNEICAGSLRESARRCRREGWTLPRAAFPYRISARRVCQKNRQ